MQHSTQWLEMNQIVDELLMNHGEINLCLLEVGGVDHVQKGIVHVGFI